MISSVYILKQLAQDYIASITGTILSVAVSGSDFVLTVCDPFYLRFKSVLTIGATDYTVSTVNENTVTVSGAGTPLKGDTFTISDGYVFNGTPIQTAIELSKILRASNKTPMIYIKEIVKDKFYSKFSELPQERDTDVELYFLDQANYQDWDTDEHYSDAVHPMLRFSLGFKEFLDNHKIILSVETWAVEYHSKFSVSIKRSDRTVNLFGTPVSGVKVNCSLKILAANGCLC